MLQTDNEKATPNGLTAKGNNAANFRKYQHYLQAPEMCHTHLKHTMVRVIDHKHPNWSATR